MAIWLVYGDGYPKLTVSGGVTSNQTDGSSFLGHVNECHQSRVATPRTGQGGIGVSSPERRSGWRGVNGRAFDESLCWEAGEVVGAANGISQRGAVLV